MIQTRTKVDALKDLGEKMTGETINVEENETIVGILDKITEQGNTPVSSNVVTSIWKGTQEEYEAIAEPQDNVLYIIVD